MEAHEENPEEKKITIKKIVDTLNKDLLTEGWGMEEWKSISVGMICSRLGFKRTMKRRQRAVFWNQQLAERLARKYYPEWVSAQKALK